MVRVLAFPFCAGLLVDLRGGPGDGVDLAFLGLVLFAGFEQVAHVGDRVEGLAGVDAQAVLEDVVGQVVDERGERGQQAAFGFGPESSVWCSLGAEPLVLSMMLVTRRMIATSGLSGSM